MTDRSVIPGGRNRPSRFIRSFVAVAFGILLAVAAEAQSAAFRGTFGPTSADSFDPAGYRALQGKVVLWDSLQGGESNTGSFQWGPFKLASDFTLYVAGSIGDPGVTLYWEDATTGQRQLLAPRTPPGPRWTLYRWSPPSQWRDRSVYIGAEDHSHSAWIALSAPLRTGFSFQRCASLILLDAGLFAALLLPGWAWGALILHRRTLSAEQFLLSALVASGTVAYGIFWVFFLRRAWGVPACWVALAAGIAILVVRRGSALRTISADLAKPLMLSLAASLMYLAGLFLYGGVEGASELSLNRFIHGMPPDPLLPAMLSERLFSGAPVRPFFGDWLSSDRPPLQAAFNLMLSPLGVAREHYQVMATILQTWVFLGLWLLLRAARIAARTMTWVLSFVVFSGFFFFNSTFVWPKLLPATFLLIAVSLLGYQPDKKAITVGACLGLAMLGHGGSAFALVGMGIYFVLVRRSIRLRFALLAGVVLAAYLLPWSLYQKYYDPPGDRLLKWHLAGVSPVDSRSFSRTLVDSYRSLSWSQYLGNRAANFRALFVNDGSRIATDLGNAVSLVKQDRTSAAFRKVAYTLRIGGVHQLFHSPGILDLGFFALIFAVLRRGRSGPGLVLAGRCLSLAAICIVLWCLLMFRPGATVSHQGTYLVNSCIFVAFALGLMELPRLMLWALAAANIVVFLLVWVFSSSRGDFTVALLSSEDRTMLSLFVAAFILTVWSLLRMGRGNTSIPWLPDQNAPKSGNGACRNGRGGEEGPEEENPRWCPLRGA
jgi:hypothetical protein